MPRAAVIVAVVLALALGVAAYFTMRTPPAPAPAGALIRGVDWAAVSTLTVRSADGTVTVLTPGEGGVSWVVSTGQQGSGMRWPASESRVRAMLRLLGELNTASPDVSAVGAGATQVEIRTAAPGAGAVTLRVAGMAVAGKTAVACEGVGVAYADAALAEVFRAENLEAWREPAVFPLSPSEGSRVEFTSESGVISLARVGKNWSLTKPIAAPADAPMMEQVLKTLGGIAVRRFEPVSAGKAAATIRVETDQRDVVGEAVKRSVIVQEIQVRGPADIGGQSLRAFVVASRVSADGADKTTLWGPVEVIVDAAALRGVAMDASAYITRTPLRVPSADVFGVGLSRAGVAGGPSIDFVRSGGAWERRGAGPDAGFDGLWKLVSQERATGTTVGTEPDGFAASLDAAIQGHDGAVIQKLRVGTAAGADAASPRIVVSDGTIHWVYDGRQREKLAAWIVGIFPD